MSDGATVNHKKVLQQTMNYVLHTKHRGLNLRPTLMFKDRHEKFIIKGRIDRNYSKNPETIKIISKIEVTLNGASLLMRSIGQKISSFLLTKAELVAIVLGAQEIIHAMRLLESMGLLVMKPMTLESDNKGAIYICNTWSVNGRTKHIDTRHSLGS